MKPSRYHAYGLKEQLAMAMHTYSTRTPRASPFRKAKKEGGAVVPLRLQSHFCSPLSVLQRNDVCPSGARLETLQTLHPSTFLAHEPPTCTQELSFRKWHGDRVIVVDRQ